METHNADNVRNAGTTRAERQVHYLDNCVTTKLDDRVVKVMMPLLTEQFYVPEAHYAADEMQLYEQCMARVKRCLNCCEEDRVLFTSSGTESCNLVINSMLYIQKPTDRCHVITSQVEHPAVAKSCRFLQEKHAIPVTYLPTDCNGVVQPAELEKYIDAERTVLVSMTWIQHVTGVVQPVEELAHVAHAAGALFHLDACQVPGRMHIDFAACGADYMSLSAHKFGGPKGVGIVVARAGSQIFPLVHGAPATNLAGIAGTTTALELAVAQTEVGIPSMLSLRNELERGLVSIMLPDGHRCCRVVCADAPRRSPSHTFVHFSHRCVVQDTALLLRLLDERHGVLASAAHSSAAHKSASGVRFSLSWTTTAEDVQATVAALRHELGCV
eukprot:TRINITY_DN7079_c0_g1_i1.p1 TRINITY_DN7079_c0_g1~~TRINITY_DN7079_c0_g1_i1.p1  ORF type:complete len:385 (+),score=95.69 TRINITY_DN7079_c0_g1_i1:51-1205(+)